METLTTENTSTSEVSAPRRGRDLWIAVPFIVFFLVQLAHHQFWRDEMNAWGLAAASATPRKLLGNIHFEGHASLWYAVLWVATRFTASPMALKFVEAIIGVSIYVAVSMWSPFSRLEKILLFLSYFISFEYTVISRMYGLCLLLVLVYLHFRITRPERLLFNAALLGLIANTDVMGVTLSFALLVEYAVDEVRKRWQNPISLKKLVAPGLVYTLMLAFSAWTLKPNKHISWRTTHHMFENASNANHFFQAVLSYVVVPWVPITSGFPHHFWNPWLGDPWQRSYIILLLPVIVGILLVIFRQDLVLFAVYLITAGCAIIFGHLVYMGSTRHYGITVIAFLAAFWMQRYRRSRVPVLGVLLLGASAVAGLQAAVGQWNHPFSNAGAAARWLRDHHLEKAVLVGTPDTSVAGVAEQLERPIYFLDCNCSDDFLLFADRRDAFNVDQIPQRLTYAAEQLHAPEMILLDAYALTNDQLKAIMKQSFRVEQLAQFTGSEVEEEDFFVYRVTRADGNNKGVGN